jgi:hypothetical protein
LWKCKKKSEKLSYFLRKKYNNRKSKEREKKASKALKTTTPSVITYRDEEI